ncbi:hypothetical protein BDZ45DRAFT_750577 [Acephala macrosclerotiorum]|nr:hypothetical protein BDZ45DRAFT_750577 [Acephala macrosclerotiorum]
MVLLFTFFLLRLIGPILLIIGIEHTSKSFITGSLVCISIGISPLTLICLGLLARVNQAAQMPIPRSIFQILSTIFLAGLCLGVYGGTQLADTTNAANFTHYNTYSKISISIFTSIFVIILFHVPLPRYETLLHSFWRTKTITRCWIVLTVLGYPLHVRIAH